MRWVDFFVLNMGMEWNESDRIGSVQKTEKKIGIEQKNRGLAIKFFEKK